MIIAVHSKFLKPEDVKIVEHIFSMLNNGKHKLLIYEPFAIQLSKHGIKTDGASRYASPEGLGKPNMMVSIGGDGTLLDAVTFAGRKETPILGLNTGRLGFLTSASGEQMGNTIQEVLNGKYTLDKRTMVHLETDGPIPGGIPFGLNEFVISKIDNGSMVKINLSIDGQYLNTYWGDGIIISTPTGSTGYSLSSGGPIVTPGSGNFVITPISAHNLNVRPLVVPETCSLDISVTGRTNKVLLALDSRSVVANAEASLKVRKEDFNAVLISLQNVTFYDRLREKLNWGLDVRN